MNKSQPINFILIIFGVLIVFFSVKFTSIRTINDPGPSFLPMISGAAMALLGALLFLQNSGHINNGTVANDQIKVTAKKFAFAISLPVYFLLLQWSGFLIATIIFLISGFTLLSAKPFNNIVTYILTATAFALTLNFLFTRILTIPLPEWGN